MNKAVPDYSGKWEIQEQFDHQITDVVSEEIGYSIIAYYRRPKTMGADPCFILDFKLHSFPENKSHSNRENIFSIINSVFRIMEDPDAQAYEED